MKKIITAALLLIAMNTAYGQLGGALKRLGNTASSTVQSKADQAVSDKVSKSWDETFSKKKKSGTDRAGATTGENVPVEKQTTGPGAPKVPRAISKFDFVQGEQITFEENFGSEALGEMPIRWTTSGKGEVMQLDGLEGQWLRGFKGSKLTSLPTPLLGENYTIEFDLVYYFNPREAVYVMPDLLISILNDYRKPQSGNPRNGETSFTFNIHPKPEKSLAWMDTYVDAPAFRSDDIEILNYAGQYNKVQHYAIQVQGKRVRVWLDQEKIFDLPQVIETGRPMSRICFELGHSTYTDSEVGYFVSNLRFAKGLGDTRHQLIDKGEYSTSGITFSVNSATILPQSYGIIKNLASLLKQHADINIKITGHTSSDGDPAKNKTLSTARASAVKDALVQQFGIDETRLHAEGKGDTEPVASNKTPEGRSQNRRVSFLKLK